MCGCRNQRTTESSCRRWQQARRGYVSMDIYNAQSDTGCNCNCSCNCCG